MAHRIDQHEFSSLSAQFRSVPFWSLNDELQPAEIERQLEEFEKGGFGGAYLHSRTGLLTEYLGDEWWAAMDAGVRAGERLGLEIWFYDEDKWPSGFAGGLVPLASESFHSRSLIRLDRSAELPVGSKVIAEDDTYKYVDTKCQWETLGSTALAGWIFSIRRPWRPLSNEATNPMWRDTETRSARS